MIMMALFMYSLQPVSVAPGMGCTEAWYGIRGVGGGVREWGGGGRNVRRVGRAIGRHPSRTLNTQAGAGSVNPTERGQTNLRISWNREPKKEIMGRNAVFVNDNDQFQKSKGI